MIHIHWNSGRISDRRLAAGSVVVASASLPLAAAYVWNLVKASKSVRLAACPTCGNEVNLSTHGGPASARAGALAPVDAVGVGSVVAFDHGSGPDAASTADSVNLAVFAAERTVANAAELALKREDRALRRRQLAGAAAADRAAETANEALRSIQLQVEDMAATVSAAASVAASSLAKLAPTDDPETASVASRLAATVAAAADSLTKKTALAAVTVALAASEAATRAAEAEAQAAALDVIDNERAAAAVSHAADAHIATVRELAEVAAQPDRPGSSGPA